MGDMTMDATATGVGTGLRFTVETNVTRDLAYDARRADALITVRAHPATGQGVIEPVAVVLLMDCSLSMKDDGRIRAARQAVCAAVDALPDGTPFAVVAGNHKARTVYPRPPDRGLAIADPHVREEAKRWSMAMRATGRTAIGRWLTHAGALLEAAPPGAARYVSLYTDGKNNPETSEELDRALAACAAKGLRCDARGIGDDWSHEELLRITRALHGTARAVDTGGLTADITRLVRRAQDLAVPEVCLRLRLYGRFRLDSVRQIRPAEADLTGLAHRDGAFVRVPLGAWGPELRQYRLSLGFDPDSLPFEEGVGATRIELLVRTRSGTWETCVEAPVMEIRRHRTRDSLPARPEEFTRAEDAHQLGLAMRGCAKAYRRGDLAEADRRLDRALALARKLGHAQHLLLLKSVAVRDEDGGVCLRRDVTPGQMERLGLESTYTMTGRGRS